MLVELRNYMRSRRIASLLHLSHEFKAPPEVIRDMLALWIRKGQVGVQAKPPACGKSCTQCDPLALEVYRYVTPPVTIQHSTST